MPDLFRRAPIPIGQFGHKNFLARFVRNIGNALVGAQALRLIGDVARGNPNLQTKIEHGVDLGRNLFSLELLHSLLEQANIRVVAYGFDVAVLFTAEQVPRAAQLQIERRDFEPGAQVAEFLQRRQTLARNLGKLRIGGHQHVGVGTPVPAPHAAAQLIQLAEAIALRVLNDDGVREWNIDAILDDRGRHQYVEFVAHEAQQHALQLSLTHLAVPHTDPNVGQQFLDGSGALENGVDAVMDEVNLALPRDFLL